MTARILTKSIHDPISESDGIRILVTRFHPRKKGFKKGIAYDIWYRELAPSAELLKKYKTKQIDENQFAEQYSTQLVQEFGAIEQKAWLVGLVRIYRQTITLLCYERDGEFCHRHLLKAELEKELSGNNKI